MPLSIEEFLVFPSQGHVIYKSLKDVKKHIGTVLLFSKIDYNSPR